jgi:hypothetical protein
MVSRDFAKIVLEGEPARAARVFVDPVRLVTPAENEKFHAAAVGALSARLQVVDDKKDANYLIQMIMQRQMDYAIRNPQQKPAVGYMLVSICKLPIVIIATECMNSEYFYFEVSSNSEVFAKVFNMWLEATVPTKG